MSSNPPTLLSKMTAEAIGTFGLVFAGTGAIIINDLSAGAVTHVGIAITFGLIVMTMIYAVGETSGGHINPAVTLGFWVARRMPGSEVPPYIISQVIGAFAATGVLAMIFAGHPTLGATEPAGPAMQSFWLEVILTAILMFVILCVATGSKEIGIMAGIAIGGVVGLEAMYAAYHRHEREGYADLARRFGLVVSGGSDYHGTYKEGLELGRGYGDLEVPETILEGLRELREGT